MPAAKNKTRPTRASVSRYLASVEPPRRREQGEAMLELFERATKTKPSMWGPSIIGFGKHHYKYPTGREDDTMAVGFAARKSALVLYGLVLYDEGERAARELGEVTLGKGCLYVKDLEKIDLEALERLVGDRFAERNNAG